MLAGVDDVLMGAGLPTEIPRLLDALAEHELVRLPVTVQGALPGEDHHIALHPRELIGEVPGRHGNDYTAADVIGYVLGSSSGPTTR